MLFEHNDSMSHEREEVCGRHPGRAAADNGDLFTRGDIGFGSTDRVGICLIHSIFLKASDVDGFIHKTPAAFFLTRMLTYERTCSRKRVAVPDDLHSAGIVFLFYHCDISRHIDMRGA